MISRVKRTSDVEYDVGASIITGPSVAKHMIMLY